MKTNLLDLRLMDCMDLMRETAQTAFDFETSQPVTVQAELI
jgi:hypothetical protein